jgi:hypothetical protein
MSIAYAALKLFPIVAKEPYDSPARPSTFSVLSQPQPSVLVIRPFDRFRHLGA